MSKLDTNTVLKLLAAEYERSKQEQIERFLKDQEELNKRFNEFSIHSENGRDDEDDGDSDTESIFTQRMSVYKSRPQTSTAWTELERERDQTDDRQSGGSPNCHVSEEEGDEWKSAVATAAHVATAMDIAEHHSKVRGEGRLDKGGWNALAQTPAIRSSARDNMRPVQSQGQGQLPKQGHAPSVGHGPSGLDSRLLARRTARPRTATGIQSSRPKKHVDTDHQDEVDNLVSVEKQRPARASAPAVVSRVRRISWEPENKPNSFLPEQKQAGMLGSKASPTYATRPKQSKFTVPQAGKDATSSTRAPSRGPGLDASNSLIISSMNPHVRGSKESLTMEQRHTADHGGKLPREYNKRDNLPRDALVRDSLPRDALLRDSLTQADNHLPRDALLRDSLTQADNHLPSLGDFTSRARQVAVLKLPPLEVGVGSSSTHRSQGYNTVNNVQTTNRSRGLSRQEDYEYLVG